MSPENAKQIRLTYRETQEQFAQRIGVSIGTLRDWEQGRRPIPLLAVNFLKHLSSESNPQLAAVSA